MVYTLVINLYLNLPLLLTIATLLYIVLLLIVIVKEGRR
jgi:hypothetical protein